MKKYNITDIRNLRPCYDPVTGEYRILNVPDQTKGLLSEDWTGTILDILQMKDCPVEDRLWVVESLGIDNRILQISKDVRFKFWSRPIGFTGLIRRRNQKQIVKLIELLKVRNHD